MSKRRMCVSIKQELYKPADEVTKKYGPAIFVGACLLLLAKKNPVFMGLLLEAIEELNNGHK